MKRTKSGKSRIVPLAPIALEALRRHRATQAAEKLAAGGAYTDEGIIFADEIGRLLTPMTATCAFERLARKAGISTTRLHDTRHTAASALLNSGVDISTVSAILGHANGSTTLNIYSHVMPKAQHTAVNLLGDHLEQARKGIGGATIFPQGHQRATVAPLEEEQPRNHRLFMVAPTGIESEIWGLLRLV